MSDPRVPSLSFPEGVLIRKVGNEMVLLNLRTENYFGLDAVGADIVNRLTQAPIDEAIEELCRDYEVDPDVLRSDVHRLVAELTEAGLLEPKSRA